jgi:hypothetical protein
VKGHREAEEAEERGTELAGSLELDSEEAPNEVAS